MIRTYNEDLPLDRLYALVSLTAQRARRRGHLGRDGDLLQVIGLVSEIIFVLSFCICIIFFRISVEFGVAILLHLQNVRTHGS